RGDLPWICWFSSSWDWRCSPCAWSRWRCPAGGSRRNGSVASRISAPATSGSSPSGRFRPNARLEFTPSPLTSQHFRQNGWETCHGPFMDLITTTADLAAACSRLAKHPVITVDTEFLRETTYYPLLCVVQMASPEEAVVVDTLAE